jgi:hypothetical protein
LYYPPAGAEVQPQPQQELMVSTGEINDQSQVGAAAELLEDRM